MITRHGRPFGPLVQSNLASRADNLRERSRVRQRKLVNSTTTADVPPSSGEVLPDLWVRAERLRVRREPASDQRPVRALGVKPASP